MAYHSAITSKNDFLVDISRNKVGDYRILSLSGSNPDIDTGVEEDLWPQGGLLSYLASEETMDIVSTDAADSDPLAIFISGVDGNYNIVSEVIVLDGLTPVTTTQAFFRVNFMFLSGEGSTNAGFITATASTASTVQCAMLINTGISQHGFFTVPAGKIGNIFQVEINAAKISGGGSPVLAFSIYVRFTPATPWIAVLTRRLDTGVQDSLVIPFIVSAVLSPGADIRLSAISDATNTTALMRVTGVLSDV